MANSIQLSLATIILVVAALAPVGSAIKCWNCTSKTDKACADKLLTTEPAAGHWSAKYVVDCATGTDKSHADSSLDPAKSDSFCRKQYQEVDGNTWVIRSCGFVKGDRACYTTANPPTKTVACQCDSGDFCNSAFGVSMSPLALVAAILTALLIRFQN
ncbi:hypothetical protein HDE_02131 [Halotydeus destructor]|nr:hypothetical protein HDE_02131 [Halotydeus destructor]